MEPEEVHQPRHEGCCGVLTRWAPTSVTTPGPHARDARLHPRLTVALAATPVRSQVVAALAARTVAEVDLEQAARGVAAEHAGERTALRARLDAAATRAAHDAGSARSQLDQLTASRQALLDGAAWALRIEADLPAHLDAVQAARAVLEARLGEQRVARTGLDRVLEQRAAAGAAMEEADRELAELVGVGMDESGLRRELEASGHAVRSAQQAYAAALARLQALQAERDEVERRCASLREALDGGAVTAQPAELEIDRVLEARRAWADEVRFEEADPEAQALAAAFTDLAADLAELQRRTGPRPDESALALAEAEAERALAAIEAIDAGSASPALTAVQRAEVDAAHEAVLEAEERLNRRIGAAGARKRAEEAHRVERELLDRYGFPSYVDVMLSGGRAASLSPERLAAERAYLAATAARDGLRRAVHTSPELQYLESERARLHAHATETLGVDPGDLAIQLLRAHPRVARPIVAELRDALAQVGVHPVEVSLADAADAWLDEQVARLDEDRRAHEAGGDARAELAALTARATVLVAELDAAGRDESHTAEQHELAMRSVGAFEAELSLRAGEDEQRVKRFAAAEQLRMQVEALAGTLARAEKEALAALDRASEEAGSAELALDRAQDVVDGVAQHARRLAAELPIDQRPAGDPLASLPALAERLAAHAEVLQPDIAAAETATSRAAVSAHDALAAAEAAGDGSEVRDEDVLDGLATLLDAGGDELVVLDEPFADREPGLRRRLLDAVVERSGSAPCVLLTDDADALGWAIELPAEHAAVVPAASLLPLAGTGGGPAVVELTELDDHAGTAGDAPGTPHPNRLDHPDHPDPSSASAERWAGRR